MVNRGVPQHHTCNLIDSIYFRSREGCADYAGIKMSIIDIYKSIDHNVSIIGRYIL